MKNLFQKVLEVKNQNNHSVDDINIVVKSTIKSLNNQYRKGLNKKKIEDGYISEEYKAFITYLKNDNKELDRLFTECIIDETRIANFVKGDTKRPHNKTKDFFAVYCGFEGYNDFVANNKNINKITTNKDSIIQSSTILNLSFVAEHSVTRSETLIDAFEAGLNYFFIDYFENFDKEHSNKEFSSKNTFPVLFKSLNLDGVFSFDTFDFILKRLMVNKHKLDNESSPFDDEETQTIFVIGNLIADRIFNRITIDLYEDSEYLHNRRVEIDNTILSILAWMDLEYVYLNTIANYNSIDADGIVKFISMLKGAIRKKYPYNTEIADFISKIYLLGFESKIDEILSYKNENKYEEVDSFLSQIQELHSRETILHFTKLENTNDLELIKEKLNCSSLKDYFMFGELIAQDLIGCLVFNTRKGYKSKKEFEHDMSFRKIREIENISTSLNLLDLYNLYMPKLYYDDNRCKLDGNYNVFLMKVLKQIKDLN